MQTISVSEHSRQFRHTTFPSFETMLSENVANFITALDAGTLDAPGAIRAAMKTLTPEELSELAEALSARETGKNPPRHKEARSGC
jgi:hypothetical protein